MVTVLLLKFSRTPKHKEKEHKVQIIVVDVHDPLILTNNRR